MNTTQQKDMGKISMVTDIIVIGGGYAGLKAASQLSGSGYKVILADNKDKCDGKTHFPSLGLPADNLTALQSLENEVKANKKIEILPEADLIEASGMPGDFTLQFSSKGKLVKKRAGAVVVASDLSIAPLNEIYGLKASANVLSVSEFENLMADNDKRQEIQNSAKTVAFLVGFAQEGNPLLMKRVLSSVSDVVSMDGCSAYVYVNNIKVADDGLERLYKQCRDNGAIYFKLQKAPTVRQESANLTISFYDPVIRNDIELNPDIIVYEEGMLADDANISLAETLRIDLGPMGFLQKENVHRLPVSSNREGIFVVGASRDVQNLSKSWADIDNMVLRINQLIGDGEKAIAAKAVVDREKCTICLTCYRCCPHGAISWDDKAVISPVACQGCGICASECPMDAIQLADYTDTEMTERIKSAGAAKTAGAKKIVAFCCQNSAYEAGMAAKAFNHALPAGLQMIKVPCAGKVDIQYMLNAFVEGADGVLVLACHHGNCKSESGNTYAKWRINDAYRKLAQVGIDKDRLEFATLASNMASDFARIVIDMEKRIGQKIG